MKNEKNEKNEKYIDRSKTIIAVAVAVTVIAAAVIAVILFTEGKVPSGRDPKATTDVSVSDTESYAPVGESSALPETQPVTETETQLVPDGFDPVNETVTAKELTNLRTSPDGSSEIVGTLRNGETLLRTGIGDDGWSRLELDGRSVYAVTSYLTTDLDYRPNDLPQADVVSGNTFTPKSDSVTAKEYVNLRALPTTDSEILGTLKSGDFLERTAVSDKGWSRLVYNGQYVYAVTSYLSNEVVPPYVAPDGFDPVDEEVTAKSQTNLRTSPDFDKSEVVHTLAKGEYVRRVAVNHASGWSRLEYDGQTVYAVSSYLEVKGAE